MVSIHGQKKLRIKGQKTPLGKGLNVWGFRVHFWKRELMKIMNNDTPGTEDHGSPGKGVDGKKTGAGKKTAAWEEKEQKSQ